MTDFISNTQLEPGQAQVVVFLTRSGSTRFVVRGPDKNYFDWIMDNTERESLIRHLLLQNEIVLERRWWHRFVFWQRPAPLLITAIEWE